MNIIIDDQLTKPFKRYRKSFDKTLNWITAEVSMDFASYVKYNYLMGQKLKRRTGRTFQSVKFFKIKDKQMGIRPGVGIRGSLNYLGRWTGTRREFMSPALGKFSRAGKATKVANFLLQQQLRKMGF